MKAQDSLTDAQIDEILKRFVQEDVRTDQADQDIDRLRRVKSRVTPRLVEMLITGDDRARAIAASLLGYLRDKRAISPLQKILEDPRYNDDLKLSVFSVLHELGAEVDEEDLYTQLQDPEAAIRRSMNRMLGMFGQPAQLALFFEYFKERPTEVQVTFARGMAALNDQRALHLLVPLLYSDDEDVVLAAIETVTALKDPTPIPSLHEIAEFNPSQLVRVEARKAVAHLTMHASVQGHPRPPEGSPSYLPIYGCLISTIDGDGGQVAFIARQRPDGNLMIFDVMFNDHQGIKDAFGIESITEEEFETNLVETLSYEGIELVDIRLKRVREQIARAHRLTLEVGRNLPAEYLIWRCLLEGEEDEEVEEHALPILNPDLQNSLLSTCDQLLELDEFESWFFNLDEIEEYADLTDIELERKRRNWRTRLDQIITRAIRAIIVKERRELIRQRLDRQAWIVAQLYSSPEVSLWCLAAARALDDDSTIPIEAHPLLRGMVIRSIENALEQPIAHFL